VILPFGITPYQLENNDGETQTNHLSFLDELIEVIADWSPVKARYEYEYFWDTKYYTTCTYKILYIFSGRSNIYAQYLYIHVTGILRHCKVIVNFSIC
jgi:hypothetical protein